MVLRPHADFGGGGGYVDSYPQRNSSGGGHHFYESIKTELDSFRLRGGDEDGCGNDFASVAADALQSQSCNDDASSIASKKRIDSMFKATAASSVAGDEYIKAAARPGRTARRARSLAAAANDDDGGGGRFDFGRGGDNKNTVQQKIEKMFAEVSSSELDTDASIESAAAAAATAGNTFHVQYIGRAELSGKISSLEGLQRPVRDMYFAYRENQHRYRRDGERARDFSGLLEISAAGLGIRYRDERGAAVHRTDAFPSIAVWAALKYVCRRGRRGPSSQSHPQPQPQPYEYAFLPLIADPDGSDKAPLFRDLDAGDRARLDAAGDHAPVFAVVTRRRPDGGHGGPRPLECHGFACETENDALLMAANLYGALVAAMQRPAAQAARARETEPAADGAPRSPRRYIRQRNGFTSMSSTAGSSVAGEDAPRPSPPALPPPRPPRRNKKSASSVASSTAGGDDVAADVCGDAKTFRMTVGQPPSLRRGVCNSGSSPGGGAAAGAVPAEQPHGGDILTKVAIPRSRSFLHSNGLASGRYSRRAAGCGIGTGAADARRRRSNGSSVMGFSDMFDELRVQEGLNSMDEILDAIIDAEGMSYNDLKPIYREFLAKVSVTLTKDELYQRTKAIMAEQKRRRDKRAGHAKGAGAGSAAAKGRGRRLNEKLRRALDLRAAGSRIGAALLPDSCGRGRRRKPRKKPAAQPRSRRCACSAGPAGRKSQRRAVASAALSGRRQPLVASSVCSTSDESEFFAAAAAAAIRQRHGRLKQQQQQLHRQLQQQQVSKDRRSKNERGGRAASEGGCLHRASSGYFSCSECSAGAADDRCYCPAARAAAEPSSLVSCSCDSDSCADSDKCYCGRPRRARNIFDELKSRGFAASESSASRADSPGTAWKKNELMMVLHQRHDPDASSHGAAGKCGVEPTKSIEYLQMARRRSSSSSSSAAAAAAATASVAASAARDRPHYSSVAAKNPSSDRMKVYGGVGASSSSPDSTTAAGSSSSPASSLSAATVYSSSSAVGGGSRHRQRRSGSSGSDNFRAIDYALFATTDDGLARKSRPSGCGRQHYRSAAAASTTTTTTTTTTTVATTAAMAGRRSYSSEAVHLTGCRVYHTHQQYRHRPAAVATRRHSVHDGGADDTLSSFFRSDIENSLGYYP